MPPRKQVERSAATLNRISGKAQQAAQRLLAAAEVGEDGRPVVTQNLVTALVGVIEQSGDMTASLAGDLAHAQLQHWDIAPKVELAPGVNPDRAAARLRWAGTAPDVAANVAGLVDELVKQPYRSTIADTAKASGVRWARVPTGATTCGFCIMLASRGAVYRSEAKAGYTSKKYHAHDDCVPTLVRDERDYPEGYDPDALYSQYNDARMAAGPDPVKIAAEIERRAVASAVADEAPAAVTWISDSIKGENLADYDSLDLQDLYGEAVDAGDEEAIRLTSAELTRREKHTAGYRGTGYTRAELRTQYAEYVDRSYWEAESVTNGHLLNAEGRRAKIDPKSLFTGSDARALKYASDDLKYHWLNAPRLSFDAFTGDADAIARAGKVDF